MLNAFRHQRSFHAQQCMSPKRKASAQRLSASKIISLSKTQVLRVANLCAQRLSASKIISLKFGIRRVAENKCSTPFGIKDHFTAYFLNSHNSILQPVFSIMANNKSFSNLIDDYSPCIMIATVCFQTKKTNSSTSASGIIPLSAGEGHLYSCLFL